MPPSLPLLDPTRPAKTSVAVSDGRTVAGRAAPGGAGAPGGVATAGAAGGVATELTGTLLGRLRSPGSVRPPVDHSLAGGLRAWLEDGVVAVAAHGGPALVVRPGQDGGLTATADEATRLSGRALRTTLLRTVFRITVTSGPPRAAFEDALAALAVDEEGDTVAEAVRRLPRHRRAQLRELVRHAASGITAQWGPPPASWLPRTGERLAAPLAGGRVVLRSDADLAMGGPSAGRASVCAVRAHGGAVRDDGPNRRLLALLETLRSGAAPFRVASYDLDRARLTVEDVTDGLLSAAVHDVLALVDAHTRVRAGGR